MSEVIAENTPLYYKGNINLLKTDKKVSIIGSRNVSNEGLEVCSIITKYLVEQGVIIVSGLAEGIDRKAHITAIMNKGKTIGVIGTPLNAYYPKSNMKLQDEIAKNHLLISQFPEGSKVKPSNFPIRNKTMAFISDTTIIIEASENSGTKHQAKECIRLGKRLFIMEDTVNKGYSWVNDMIKQGAYIVTKDNYKELLKQ